MNVCRFALSVLLVPVLSAAVCPAAPPTLAGVKPASVEVALPPAHLYITVRDSQGRAVHGAMVVLSGAGVLPQNVVRTNIAGLAVFQNLAPGDYTILAAY